MQADGEEANQAINRSADQGTTNVGKSPPEDELPYLVYLVTCLSYLLVVALAAIFIDDLTLIFGIIAGLAECSTVFILPSIFYLIACNRVDKQWIEFEAAMA